MNRIYLVRHAESVANTLGIYQGQTYDTGLSPLGYRQAIRLAGYFKNYPLDRIITSPLKRTAITAHLVSTRTNTPVTYESRIIETNHGTWEGVSREDIITRWPVIYFAWQNYPSRTVFPGGESFWTTRDRVMSWWQDISAVNGHTLVVTHDNIIRIILACLAGTDLDHIWEFNLYPASVTVIENNRIVTSNHAPHLEGLLANLSSHAL